MKVCCHELVNLACYQSQYINRLLINSNDFLNMYIKGHVNKKKNNHVLNIYLLRLCIFFSFFFLTVSHMSILLKFFPQITFTNLA